MSISRIMSGFIHMMYDAIENLTKLTTGTIGLQLTAKIFH
jgi:hypothetical protein